MDSSQRRRVGIVVNVPFISKATPAYPGLIAGTSVAARTAYLDVLAREVAGATDVLAGREVAFVLVRGNAAMVPPDALARLVRQMRTDWSFARAGEVTMEMTPDTVCTASLTALNTCGFTHLRIKALSADARTLEELGSPWGVGSVAEALSFVELMGYANVALEVACGVPGATEDRLRRDVGLLTESEQIGEVTFVRPPAGDPAETTRVDTGVPDVVRRLLERRGFAADEAGRFVRRGGWNRAALALRTGIEHVGFGLGASSRVDGYASWNTADLDAYLASGGDYTKLVVRAEELGDQP